MPILFLILGALFLVTAIKGNQNEVATQLGKDFTGTGNFFVWVGAVLLIAVLGQVTNLKRTAEGLIALLVIVYLVSENGVFTKFQQAFTTVSLPSPTTASQVGSSNDVAGTTTPTSGTTAATTTPAPATNTLGSLFGGWLTLKN